MLNEQSTKGGRSSGFWQSYFSLLFCSVCGYDCTQVGEVERYAVLPYDVGHNGNLVAFGSHTSADALSWHPSNWKLNVSLCEQSGQILKPINEARVGRSEYGEMMDCEAGLVLADNTGPSVYLEVFEERPGEPLAQSVRTTPRRNTDGPTKGEKTEIPGVENFMREEQWKEAELKTVSRWIGNSRSVPMSGIEQIRLRLQEMANVLTKQVNLGGASLV